MNMRESHEKQTTSALIVGLLFIALCPAGIMVFLFDNEMPHLVKLLYAVYLLALGMGMIKVLHDRIEEIRKGETDDLDNY